MSRRLRPSAPSSSFVDANALSSSRVSLLRHSSPPNSPPMHPYSATSTLNKSKRHVVASTTSARATSTAWNHTAAQTHRLRRKAPSETVMTAATATAPAILTASSSSSSASSHCHDANLTTSLDTALLRRNNVTNYDHNGNTIISNNNTSTSTRPDDSFLSSDAEMRPEDGILQFVPTFGASAQRVAMAGATWDDLLPPSVTVSSTPAASTTTKAHFFHKNKDLKKAENPQHLATSSSRVVSPTVSASSGSTTASSSSALAQRTGAGIGILKIQPRSGQKTHTAAPSRVSFQGSRHGTTNDDKRPNQDSDQDALLMEPSLLRRGATGAASTTGGSITGGGGGRIARLASLFGNQHRAQHQQQHQQLQNQAHNRRHASPPPTGTTTTSNARRVHNRNSATTARPPSSPVDSSSGSSGYVGWPGTQDKGGRTVQLQSSYDDSSAGPVVASVLPLAPKNTSTTQAVAREMSRWTGSSPAPAPSLLLMEDFLVTPESRTTAATPTLRNPRSLATSTTTSHSALSTRRWNPPSGDASVDLRAAAPAARKTSLSAMRYAQSDVGVGGGVSMSANHHRGTARHTSTATNAAALNHNPGSIDIDDNDNEAWKEDSFDNFHDVLPKGRSPPEDPWGTPISKDDAANNPASPGSESGGTTLASSAYFQEDEMHHLEQHQHQPLQGPQQPARRSFQTLPLQQHEHRRRLGPSNNSSTSAPSILPPTQETLALKDHYMPPHRPFVNAATKGYPGLLDKTKDVPCLMDSLMDSDSLSSSKATSAYSSQGGPSSGDPVAQNVLTRHRNTVIDAESDVFDGLSSKDDLVSDIFDNLSSSAVPSPRRLNRPFGSNNNNNSHAWNSSSVYPRTSSYPERILEEDEGVAAHHHKATATTAEDHRIPNAMASSKPATTTTKKDSSEMATEEPEFKVVMLGGGLTTIQTTAAGFVNRQTASDYDETLTNSEVDQDGFTKIPAFHEMVSAGMGDRDSSVHGVQTNLFAALRSSKQPLAMPTSATGSNRGDVRAGGASIPRSYRHRGSDDDDDDASDRTDLSREEGRNTSTSDNVRGSDGTDDDDDDGNDDARSSLFTDPYEHDDDQEGIDVGGDLSEYYVQPRLMKKLLRKYRAMSERLDDRLTLAEFEREEDEHKAFALFEMRSRIMEKDIERGLERRGGTVVVDDLVTTSYHLTAHRIRDAVIVSKAWRDGASPQDVINTALLTRRVEQTYYIKRPLQRLGAGAKYGLSQDSMFSMSQLQQNQQLQQRFYYEPVRWTDDTDFMQYRCPSLGPRHMRGFEMFTIGDCQSILLKLTNERCLCLRRELNDATRRQIEAEDLLKEEGDGEDGLMTDAEMAYLTSMEEVKTISKKLVAAERAFALVRDRIQQLVAKYESLLVKIETESFAGASSVLTIESSYCSEHDSQYWDELEDRERMIWARRAKRAEIRAEIAAREALLAKQEAQMIREEKQQELDALQQKLCELQSESSGALAEKQTSLTLAMAMRRNDSPPPPSLKQRPAPPLSAAADPITKGRLDDVKQRFRDRMAAKKQQTSTPPTVTPSSDRSAASYYYDSANSNHPHHPSNGTAFVSSTSTPRKSPMSGGNVSSLSIMSASSSSPRSPTSASPHVVRELFRAAGEEMYQHLDFYERSLKAVESHAHL